VKDQGNERSKQKRHEGVKAQSAMRSGVLAVPKGVYEGFKRSDEPFWWRERQDENLDR